MAEKETFGNLVIRDLAKEDKIPYSLLLEADPWQERIDEYLSGGKCRLALLDNAVVGVYVLKVAETEAEIMNIAISSQLRGQGLGKLLVHNATEESRKLGLRKLCVGTGNSSFAELAFYQKCGFRIVGVDFDYFANYPEKIMENGIWCRDLIRMSMELK